MSKWLILFLIPQAVFAESFIVETVAGPKTTGYLGLGDKGKLVYQKIAVQDSEIPESFDWRSVDGVLPEVRDQGSCGSCWAFAITGALESAEVVQNGKMVGNYSEQQMVSCDKYSYGCNGGFMSSADFVVRNGLADEESFPYKAKNLKCKPNLEVKAKAAKYALIGEPNRKPAKKEIQSALIKNGPLFVTVLAGGSGWSGATENVTTCRTRGSTNHMVQIVGFDKTGWWIKNSWGKEWGKDGYAHIKYGCDKIADEAGFVSIE